MNSVERSLLGAESRKQWRLARRECGRLVFKKMWRPVLEHAERVLGWSIQRQDCEHSAVNASERDGSWIAVCRECGAEARAADRFVAIDMLCDEADEPRGEACLHAARVLALLSGCPEAPYEQVAQDYIVAMMALSGKWMEQLMSHPSWEPFVPSLETPDQVYPGALGHDGRVILYLTPGGVARLQNGARVVLPAPR